MRTANNTSERFERQGPLSVRKRLQENAPGATAAHLSEQSEVSGNISRVLTSVVLEQHERERNGTGKSQHNETNGSAPGSAIVTAACEGLNGAAAVSAATADQAGDTSRESAIPSWKRLFDCTAILLTSPLWLPVMLLIMLGIKASSAGPVFYRQERIGRGGRRFLIFKFRTMKVNVETRSHESYFEGLMTTNVPMTKLDANGDPRLIRCGRFLRAAGLDELPQLFNVLRGEMSLVGPRPCTVHEFQRYLPYQRARVNAPPGLTGYWQVNGKNRTTFSEMIEMDIFYGKNMSLALDLRILCKTVPAIWEEVSESRGYFAAKARHPIVPSSVQVTQV